MVELTAKPGSNRDWSGRLQIGVRFIGAGVALFALIALLLPAQLKPAAWLPAPEMALFLLLCGSALICQAPPARWPGLRRGRVWLGAAAGLLALAVAAAEYTGVYPDPSAVTFSFAAALEGSVLLSLSLILLGHRGWRGLLGWLAAAVILAFALFVLIDYLYAFGSEVYQPIFTPMSVGAAICYAALGLGLLLARGAYPPTRSLRSAGPGGAMLRRLLLPALALPLLMLLLLRVTVRAQLVELNFGYSLVTWALIVSLAVLICRQALVLDELARAARRRLTAVESDYLRRLGLAADAAEVYFWEFDPATGRVFHSESYLAHLGYGSGGGEHGLNWWLERVHPEDRTAIEPLRYELMLGEARLQEAELRMRRQDGDYRWMYTRAKVVERGDDGRPRRVFGVSIDVTEQRLTAQRLRDAQARLSLAMDIAAVGYWEWDPRRREVYFSPEWKRLLGYADNELPSDREQWLSRLHPDDRLAALAATQEGLTGEDGWDMELRLRHRDGDWRWFLSRAVVERDATGQALKARGVYLDITERKHAETRIRQISQHDPLTGLPNRALIFEFAQPLLAGARRDGSRIAVLFVDLDRFKPINDEHGHAVGDEVLKEVARRLRASVREADLVGRLGGDEFLLLLAHLRSDEAAARVARVCLRRLDQPYRVGELELCTTPSIGISIFPRDGETMSALIRRADAAMYEVKRSGRNGFRFYQPPAQDGRAPESVS